MDIREHLVGQLTQTPAPGVVYFMTEDEQGMNVRMLRVDELDTYWTTYQDYEYVGKTCDADNAVIHVRKVAV